MSALTALAQAARHDLGAADRERLDAFAEREGLDATLVASLHHEPRRLRRFLAFYEPLLERTFGDRRLKAVVHGRVRELDALARDYALPSSAARLEPPPGLAPDEAALVAIVDALAIDHLAVAPERFDDLRRHFSDAQVMELLWAVAVARAMARAGAVLGVPYAATTPESSTWT